MAGGANLQEPQEETAGATTEADELAAAANSFAHFEQEDLARMEDQLNAEASCAGKSAHAPALHILKAQVSLYCVQKTLSPQQASLQRFRKRGVGHFRNDAGVASNPGCMLCANSVGSNTTAIYALQCSPEREVRRGQAVGHRVPRSLDFAGRRTRS